jgi:hypothetical protein
VAIAALLVWMCTAAAGVYLFATSTRVRDADAEEVRETAPAAKAARGAAEAAEAGATPEAGAVRQVRPKDRFDPPSLTRAKSEPLPGMRALAEFTHPALAITGFGFWLCYVFTRDRVFAAIGFGVLLGAICAGVSWFTINRREARAKKDALSVSYRVLALHATGAALTLLIAILIVARA